MSTLDNILDEINRAESIVILTHENPDGDAIGTGLALYNALKQIGKNPDIIIPEYPRIFGFLPGTDEIKKESNIEKYDLAISVDCATIKMLNGFANYFENAKVKVSIDHHSTNTMFGDINYVSPDSPACAQALLVILEYFKIDITKDIGTCILTGIITDTGGFKYSGVTAETFEFVAWLLNKGINVSKVYRKVLQTKTRANFELRRIAANRLEFFEEGKVAFTYITKEIGTCILTGIITDTGGFKYSGVTAETFEFVASLLTKGINVSKIYKRVLQTRTKANFELNRIAADRLEFFEDGKIAFTYITKEDEENVNAENGDHEGIVETGRDIEGVEVSIFVRQTDKGCKVSMRSNEYVNVSDVCLLLGGGGHTHAAGCLLQCSVEQAKERLLRQVKAVI